MRRVLGFAVTLVVLALAYISLVYIPTQMTLRAEFPITSTPSDYGLEFEEFSLQAEDKPLLLQGWWMPAEQARAALVFIHGKGSHRDSSFFKSLAFYAALVEGGVSVAAIDLRNHGLSGDDPQGVQWGAAEKYDALAAIDWVSERNPDLPLFAMGISMGGATLIHALADRSAVDGLILLDPLLDIHSAIEQGGWIETGLPPGLFAPSAWAATTFFGLPSGENASSALARQLSLPTLLLQDPGDPVTLALHAASLASDRPNISLWMAPEIPADHPEIAWRGRWGTHVAAFAVYPEQVLEQIRAFISVESAK